jgi:hypothetical protein
MDVEIEGWDRAKHDAIIEAACEEWPFNGEDFNFDEKKLYCNADGNLCGGETEGEFTRRLSIAIWKANGAFCDVTVTATYLEERPCETYSLDEDDYKRLIG